MVHAQHRGPDHALGADDSRFEPENGCIDAIIPAQEGGYNDIKLSSECLSPCLDSLCDKEVRCQELATLRVSHNAHFEL